MIKPFKGKNPNHEKFFIPRSVQQSIPIKKVHKDGIFEVAGLYSKTWRFFDVNYAVAGPEKKEALFLSYCAFLNSLPVRALVKITLFNRTMNQQEFSRNLLMKMVGDGKDRYRVEYNDILTDNAASSNNLTQEKYITISVERKNIEEARAFFNRVGTELGTYLSRMDVKVRDTNVVERMRLFHDFFRPHDSDFRFDLNSIIHRGNDFRDAIAPDCMTFYKDHYEMGDQVGRVLFLRDYASFIKDEMITELCDLPRNMMISINLLPIPTDEVVKEIQRRIMAIESDVGRFTQRQNSLNNFNATIPYHLEQSRLQTRELMDDVTTRDQGLMLGQVTITHLADTLEQLDQDTETLVSIGQGRGCQISTLKYQQEDGLNTVLPYGLQRVDAMRMNTVAHEVETIDHPESSEGADDGYTERILKITITGKTAEEMAAEYGFTDQQLEMLQELLEEREMLADLIGSLMNVTADAKEVLLNLPEDLSPEREAVIRAACSLVGKVNYFWGGCALFLDNLRRNTQ